jgi:hypothetical protein
LPLLCKSIGSFEYASSSYSVWFIDSSLFYALHGSSYRFSVAVARALSTVCVPTRTGVVKTLSVPGLKNGMDYVQLGDSDLVVSKVCMGTMTFGKTSDSVL